MAARELTMLLDGGCGICKKAAGWITARDVAGRIEPLPLQDPSVRVRFPHLTAQALNEALHVVHVDGRTWRGAAACGTLLRALPRWRWLAWVCWLPGAEWTYAQVAKRRATTGCEIPARPAAPT